MTDEPALTEHAKKQLVEDKKLSDKSKQEYAEKTKGKPTPTQDENDLAALGAHITEHEHDGSNPDPNVPEQRQMESAGGKPYQTRQATAAPPQGAPHRPARSE
jgi:hypothetical protein